MESLGSGKISALSVFGFGFGVFGAVILYLSADWWAALWGAPLSAEPVRWLSISALIFPCYGLASGVMRRVGEFRLLAGVTVLTNVGGMAIGVFAVVYFRSASSLLVSVIFAQAAATTFIYIRYRRFLLRSPAIRGVRGELVFTGQLSVSRLLTYFNSNFGRWGVSIGLGSGVLGQWNRADVLTTVPFQQLQASMVQAVYPEFRHDIGTQERSRKLWPDLLALVGWLTMPLSIIAAFVVPAVIPILFGPGWEVAAAVAPPLAIAGGITVCTAVLSAAVEALSRFDWIWRAQFLHLALAVPAALWTIQAKSFWPVVYSLSAVMAVKHMYYLYVCVKSGYIDPKRLFDRYSRLIMTCLFTALFGLLINLLIVSFGVWGGAVSGLLFIVASVLLWSSRNKLEPVVIARSYGLFR
jgi:O-antigen/teichoic acid export membrane protein